MRVLCRKPIDPCFLVRIRCNLINPGLVLAACYVYFIYPREAMVGNVTVSESDLRSFRVSENAEPSQVLRRLRNSLSHGDFSIDDAGIFTFCDRESFEIRVHFVDLGTFVDAFGRRMVSNGETGDNSDKRHSV